MSEGDKRGRFLLESCRPGCDDHLLPEMAELADQLQGDESLRAVYQRSQQWDTAVAEAMEDVPLPEGLAERLQQAVQPSAAPAAASRRRAIGWTAAAAVLAASLLGVFFLLQRPDKQMSGSDLVELANDWVAELDGRGWSAAAPPAAYPPDISVRLPKSWWRNEARLQDAQAVVYVDQPNNPSVVLFVIRTTQVKNLSPLPPLEAQWDTGPRRIAAWQAGPLVYVLAVNGDSQRYRDTLKRPESA